MSETTSTQTTTTEPTQTTTTAPASTPTEWFGGFPEDLKGYVQNKGFKDPAAVVDSYRNLEKLIGVKDKLLQVPDDLSSKEMENVWKRLGRPDKPEEYSFKGKDEAFDKWAKDAFHKAGLTANQAKAVTEQYDAFVQSALSEMEAKFTADNELKVNDLKKEWGSAFDQNVKVARSAAKQFGLDDSMIDSMEKAIGFAPVMKMLQAIGSKVGEASYVSATGTNGNFSGILSPAQAKERINSLINDADWSKKYLNGDVQAKNEMERLSRMATSSYEG